MRIELTRRRRVLCACGALAGLYLGATAAGASLPGTWAPSSRSGGTRPAPAAAVAEASEASARAWGVARRTTRRVEGRRDYHYGGTAAAYDAGSGTYDPCYTTDGQRYCARMVAGEVAYGVAP